MQQTNLRIDHLIALPFSITMNVEFIKCSRENTLVVCADVSVQGRSVILTDTVAVRLFDCQSVRDCDIYMAAQTAFACANGVCVCHPSSTFNDYEKTCVCIDGFVRQERLCVPAELKVCNDSSPCNLPNSVCKNNKCECLPGFVYKEDRCQVLSDIGSVCSDAGDCVGGPSNNVECVNSVCVCMPNHVVSSVGKDKCLPYVGLTEVCSDPAQCLQVNDSVCNRVCECKEGFVVNIDRTQCLKVVGYGESCVVEAQCNSLGTGSSCQVSRTCGCKSEYYYSGTKCLYIHGLGESCAGVDQGCYLEADGDSQHIICKDNSCQCQEQYQPSQDNTKCEKSLSATIFPAMLLLAVCLLISRTV